MYLFELERALQDDCSYSDPDVPKLAPLSRGMIERIHRNNPDDVGASVVLIRELGYQCTSNIAGLTLKIAGIKSPMV